MNKEYNRWKSVSEENQLLDKETDQRIWSNVETYIRKKKTVQRYFWAAAVLIPLMTGMFLMNQTKPEKKQDIIFSTAQTKKVYKLQDGSIIELEPGSTLSLQTDFGKDNRDVIFKGKGFFKIAKNKALPFRINADEFKVEVLGTQFYVDQSSADKTVHLTEGKVKIDYKNKQIFLTPKQIWKTSDKDNDGIFLEPTVQKEFTFKNQKYNEVIETLEKVYLIKIEYPEEYKNEMVNGSFNGNLEEILTIISFPFNLNIRNIDSQTIEMKK